MTSTDHVPESAHCVENNGDNQPDVRKNEEGSPKGEGGGTCLDFFEPFDIYQTLGEDAGLFLEEFNKPPSVIRVTRP